MVFIRVIVLSLHIVRVYVYTTVLYCRSNIRDSPDTHPSGSDAATHLFVSVEAHVRDGRPDARRPRLHDAVALLVAKYPVEVALSVHDHQIFALSSGNGVHPGA